MEESCNGGGSDGGGGGGRSDGGGLRLMVRLEIEGTRMQVRVTRVQIGDNLAQSRAMHLANVQTLIWVPMFGPKTEFYLRRRKILAAAQIEKGVCIRVGISTRDQYGLQSSQRYAIYHPAASISGHFIYIP